MDNSWNNPWKLIVVANWTGTKPAQQMANTTAPVKPPGTPVAPATSPRPASTVPSQTAIETCNKYAATPPSQRDKTIGVVKDAKYFGVREATEPMVYVAVWRDGSSARQLPPSRRSPNKVKFRES